MALKKTVSARKPAAKSIVKAKPKKEMPAKKIVMAKRTTATGAKLSNRPVKGLKSKIRIQTAEGWKRSTMRSRRKMK